MFPHPGRAEDKVSMAAELNRLLMEDIMPEAERAAGVQQVEVRVAWVVSTEVPPRISLSMDFTIGGSYRGHKQSPFLPPLHSEREFKGLCRQMRQTCREAIGSGIHEMLDHVAQMN